MKNTYNDNPINTAYERFTNLIKEGISVSSAFESTVSQILAETVSDVADEVYVNAYRDGYIQAMRATSEQIAVTADLLDQAGEECDCEDCQLKQEYEKCNDCDCPDGECEVDIVKMIRRAIWEDEM